MGQVVTDVQLVAGKLRIFFGPCCYHDLDVGAGELDPETPTYPDGGEYEYLLPEGGSYTACGRAAACHEVIQLVAASAWDERANPFAWQWEKHIESDSGLDDLKSAQVALAVTEALKMDIVFGQDTIFAESNLQSALCSIVGKFSATSGDLTDDEWGALKWAYWNEFGPLIGNFWTYCVQAIGRDNFDKIARAGAVTQDARCGCPEEYTDEPTTPDAAGWFLGPNLADDIQVYDGSGWSVAYCLHTATEPIYGSFLVIESINDGSDIKRMGMASAEGGFPAQTYNVSMWSDSSDHLEAMNQLYPQISDVGAAVQLSLANQRGFSYYVNGGANGVNMPTIATPEVTAGQIVGWRLDFIDNEGLVYGTTFKVKELRAIHNTNHP